MRGNIAHSRAVNASLQDFTGDDIAVF